MELKIKQRFTDKLTKEIFTLGDTIERGKERAEQLINAGVAEEVKPLKEIKVESEEVEAPKAEKPKRKKRSKK